PPPPPPPPPSSSSSSSSSSLLQYQHDYDLLTIERLQTELRRATNEINAGKRDLENCREVYVLSVIFFNA
ncbi:MAG: hypothetical protein LBD75_07740, partial [Candidatus Peribacteria bacterium]|nr:hypothetical protein [Candidatus Peribacteria bacterium]